jgi:hypothetical protein
MFNWLRRRRLTPETRKRLLLVAARAEEAIVETHVENLIDLLQTVGDEVDLKWGIDLYTEMMSLDEPRAAAVTNRLLANLESPKMKGDRGKRFRNVFRDQVGQR